MHIADDLRRRIPRTVLGIWAHPDDETYLFRGFMARTVRDGGRGVCVHATAGERGTDDARCWPPDRLGPHRIAVERLTTFQWEPLEVATVHLEMNRAMRDEWLHLVSLPPLPSTTVHAEAS